MLKEITRRGIVHLTSIYNSSFTTGYLRAQWKVAQIIMIPKAGKPPEEVDLYRPISLLPIMSKIFEEAMLKRLRPILKETRIPLDHQFGFRQQHCTIEQVHRITDIARGTLEKKTALLCGVPRYHRSV
jgi:hypothetical protein